MAEFLSENRAEAKSVSIYEYDEEKHMRQTREEGREEGKECINSLNRKLLEQDRIRDIMKAAMDAEYQEQLLKEFEL
ncbi:hypothetical protein ABE547_07750 [Dorea sp. YH-dor226]|uniref:hypothetical protein n=1 Tax=Dorea sp. YH-dor226 TaxID=3151119 RepID=UPI003241C2BB